MFYQFSEVQVCINALTYKKLALTGISMKGLIIGSLSALLMSVAISPAVRAETMTTNTTQTSSDSSNARVITPFNLVSLAYRGAFEDQGIPSYGTFLTAYRFRALSGKDIVQGAIAAKRLSPQVLSDQGYMNAVDAQIENLAAEYDS